MRLRKWKNEKIKTIDNSCSVILKELQDVQKNLMTSHVIILLDTGEITSGSSTTVCFEQEIYWAQ